MSKAPKQFLFLGALACVLAGVAVFILLGTPRRGITEENIDRIKPGMTMQEVEEILGSPPGDYSDSEVRKEQLERWSGRWKPWASNEWLVIVEFDDGDPPRVERTHKAKVPSMPTLGTRSFFHSWILWPC